MKLVAAAVDERDSDHLGNGFDIFVLDQAGEHHVRGRRDIARLCLHIGDREVGLGPALRQRRTAQSAHRLGKGELGSGRGLLIQAVQHLSSGRVLKAARISLHHQRQVEQLGQARRVGCEQV
jgi:hypothetical protein